MIDDYIKGNYKEIPIASILALVGALIYFVSPVDLIPDILPGVGYVDDAMVISAALKIAHLDLEKYKRWKNG